jgi:aspartate/methionine/tyrosine aminotransferase
MEEMATIVGAHVQASALPKRAASSQELAKSNGAPLLVSDEIYHGLVYKSSEHSILEFTDRAFVLNGFSKAYAMTGFRLGYCIVPEDFVRPMQIMQQNLFISANSFVQMAGVAALREGRPHVEHMRQEFDRRRHVMLTGLRALGFGIAVEPLGAFYVFANAKHLTKDSYQFCMDLFDATGVAVTPGIDFGKGGEGYLRFSYANSLANLQEALRRIKGYLKNL